MDVDDWYTTKQEVVQEPSAGHRRVASVITYKNAEELGEEIILEEVDYEAVPKIVKRGTKVPPTYIKPISGGRLSSNFGGRSYWSLIQPCLSRNGKSYYIRKRLRSGRKTPPLAGRSARTVWSYSVISNKKFINYVDI